MSKSTVVVSAARTAFGRFGGVLRDISSLELATLAIKEVLARVGLRGDEVNEVVMGVSCQVEPRGEPMSPIVARFALLKAGLSEKTPSLTVDRACCSSLAAIQLGYRAIKLGEANVVLVVGAENMNRTPYLIPELRWGKEMGDVVIRDHLYRMSYEGFNPVSVDAGEVALEYGVTREEQDRWALRSHHRYAQAFAEGKFKDEIIPVAVPQRKGAPIILDRDEQNRPDTTLEKLAKLATVYGSPTVTAGNAPGLNAGASAVLLMSQDKAEELGLAPLASILCVSSVALSPRLIATAPAVAIQKALCDADIALDEVGLIEINEAFAAMPLVSTKILANGDAQRTEALRQKTNVNGDAIAIGHPLGASGARILMTLMYELRRRGGGYGAAAICGGLAQGDAAVIKV